MSDPKDRDKAPWERRFVVRPQRRKQPRLRDLFGGVNIEGGISIEIVDHKVKVGVDVKAEGE